MTQNQISFYLNSLDNKGSAITVGAAIDLIKGNGLKDVTNIYHTLEPGEPKDNYKKTKFPAVTWSGDFKTRKADALKKHSGLICMDIDKLSPGELSGLIKLLRNDPYVFFFFVSPSGAGLKIILKIQINNEEKSTIQAQHLAAFKAIENYFAKQYGITVDASGKDVSRLCFLCYDSDSYFNNGAGVFDVAAYIIADVKPPVKAIAPAKLTKPQEKKLEATALTANDVFEFTQNISTYNFGVKGGRKDFIYLFACNCNRRGITEKECTDFAVDFASDKKASEVTYQVERAYKQNISDHGKFAKKPKNESAAGFVPVPGTLPAKQTTTTTQKTVSVNNAPNSNSSAGRAKENPAEPIKFWYITEKTDKAGIVSKSFNLDYNMLKKFLVQQGFFRLPLKDGNYQFIKITGNRVKPITPLHIRDFIFSHLEDRDESEATNSLTRGGKQYLSTDKFERLPYKEVLIKKHTEKAAYFYYANGMIEVTAENIMLVPYEQLSDQFIWDAGINKRSVEILKDEKPGATHFPKELIDSEIYQFLWLASCNENNKSTTDGEAAQSKWIEERIQKFGSVCTAIGYLLHQHKTPSKAKAIIAIDHQIPADRTEQNGGTGKSIVGNYILKNVLNIATIPGKDYKDDNPWRWEPITIDSQVIFFNDVKYNFNFEGIFELITDDMLINRRNIGYLNIPFDSSPKIYIATNYIVKGDGTSFRRRTHIIEFDNYFNETHTPHDEFGHNMFADWQGDFAGQWNLYDNFIFRCVQMYLQEGLLPYPGGNYEQRKLISECPQEFIDWMDATKEGTAERIHMTLNKWMEKKAVQQSWNEEAKSLSMPVSTPHNFTKMVKKYCQTKAVILTAKKTNGTEYYCFGTPPTSSPVSQQPTLL